MNFSEIKMHVLIITLSLPMAISCFLLRNQTFTIFNGIRYLDHHSNAMVTKTVISLAECGMECLLMETCLNANMEDNGPAMARCELFESHPSDSSELDEANGWTFISTYKFISV